MGRHEFRRAPFDSVLRPRSKPPRGHIEPLLQHGKLLLRISEDELRYDVVQRKAS